VSIEQWLLDLLVCPLSKVSLRQLPWEAVLELNELIADGKLFYADGSPVQHPMDGALVTLDDTSIYQVRGDTPILLGEERIPGMQASEILRAK
jgi:uncharacterized protein